MPSFTDTSHGYVQWQSARRQAKQLAQDTAIDIIEHYNRVVLKGDGDVSASRYNGHTTTDQSLHVPTDDSPRMSKRLTPRGLSKKTTTLRAENVDRKKGVFTEGISSLSRQSQFPVSLKRSDIISDNQPETVKLAKEKSRIYLALSHPGPKQTPHGKGDQSAKSVRTLPPPSSYPWADMLSVTEIARAKTFTMDDRGLVTRSSLDSRQTASDMHPATDRKAASKFGTHLPIFYPSITGAPPNTPLQMPPPYKPKAPAVNIVSLDGEAVNDNGKKSESRSRLPAPFRSMVTVNGPVAGGDSKASTKPGIDLPHLPLRYAESKDPSFTPRERPAPMNFFKHSKARRRMGGGHMKHTKIKSVTGAERGENEELAEGKVPVTDPYANRFQQTSSVTSLGEAQVFPPPRPSVESSESESKDVMVREPTIMLTVEEEDENGEKESPSAGSSLPKQQQQEEDKPPPQPSLHPSLQQPSLEVTPQTVLTHQAKARSQSLVSNASLLSVPMNVKELCEARPPPEEPTDKDEAESLTLEIPVVEEEEGEAELPGSSGDPFPDTEPEGDRLSVSPGVVSVVDTARTVATQTSLPYDPDAEENRRASVVKIKTLSMFPDINGGADGQSLTGDRPGSQATSEPLLRMTHGDSSLEGRILGLPELKGSQTIDRHLLEEEGGGGGGGGGGAGLRRKSSGVQNITFISPLEGQQKAKRF